jgi:hypothetical protein
MSHHRTNQEKKQGIDCSGRRKEEGTKWTGRPIQRERDVPETHARAYPTKPHHRRTDRKPITVQPRRLRNTQSKGPIHSNKPAHSSAQRRNARRTAFEFRRDSLHACRQPSNFILWIPNALTHTFHALSTLRESEPEIRETGQAPIRRDRGPKRRRKRKERRTGFAAAPGAAPAPRV